MIFAFVFADKESKLSIRNAEDRDEMTVIIVLYCSANVWLIESNLIFPAFFSSIIPEKH